MENQQCRILNISFQRHCVTGIGCEHGAMLFISSIAETAKLEGILLTNIYINLLSACIKLMINFEGDAIKLRKNNAGKI